MGNLPEPIYLCKYKHNCPYKHHQEKQLKTQKTVILTVCHFPESCNQKIKIDSLNGAIIRQLQRNKILVIKK